MYNITNVGYEYTKAEECLKTGDIDNAIKHYVLAIANYYNAADEYKLSQDSSYIIEENCKKQCFPILNSIVRKSYNRLRRLKPKNNFCNKFSTNRSLG